jgi:hypothetical protein
MERLSDKEISDTILDHLLKIVRKLRKDPDLVLPELKRIIVTRYVRKHFQFLWKVVGSKALFIQL